MFGSSQGPPTHVGISPSDGSRQRGCGWWTADLVSLVRLDGWSLPEPRVWAQTRVHPCPPPWCGARTQVKGPAGGQFPLVTAGPFPQCQSRRQRRREGRCSRRSHLRNRNSMIKGHARKMEIFGQAFRDLIKINIMPYGSRKLSTAHVEESI